MAIAGLAVLGFVANGNAQVQQSISFSLNLYNQTDTGVRTVHISTKDIIENLAGTNVPGGKLLLLMPNDPSPDGSTGNIGAWLRVTDSKGNIIVETDPSMFNIYQTVSFQTTTRTYTWSQFSLAFGGIGAELFGTATWTRSPRGPGGEGSFHCTINGHCALSGVTFNSDQVPCTGSIAGGSPKQAD